MAAPDPEAIGGLIMALIACVILGGMILANVLHHKKPPF